jgi:copper chaperone CopZ
MTTKNVELRVFGMTCDDCARTVAQGLRSRKGVEEAVVDVRTGTAEVTIEDSAVTPEDLLRVPIFGERSHYKALVKRAG